MSHDSLNREMKGKTHEKFQSISQSSRENWLHPAVAVRRSDSYFDFDISGAWLHVIGAKSKVPFALSWFQPKTKEVTK